MAAEPDTTFPATVNSSALSLRIIFVLRACELGEIKTNRVCERCHAGTFSLVLGLRNAQCARKELSAGMEANSSPSQATGDLNCISLECCTVPGLSPAKDIPTTRAKLESVPDCTQATCVRPVKKGPIDRVETAASLVPARQCSNRLSEWGADCAVGTSSLC